MASTHNPGGGDGRDTEHGFEIGQRVKFSLNKKVHSGVRRVVVVHATLAVVHRPCGGGNLTLHTTRLCATLAAQRMPASQSWGWSCPRPWRCCRHVTTAKADTSGVTAPSCKLSALPPQDVYVRVSVDMCVCGCVWLWVAGCVWLVCMHEGNGVCCGLTSMLGVQAVFVGAASVLPDDDTEAHMSHSAKRIQSVYRGKRARTRLEDDYQTTMHMLERAHEKEAIAAAKRRLAFQRDEARAAAAGMWRCGSLSRGSGVGPCDVPHAHRRSSVQAASSLATACAAAGSGRARYHC